MFDNISFGQMIVSIIVYLLPIVILMVIFRRLVLWYLGIDKLSTNIEEIRDYVRITRTGTEHANKE